MTTANFIIDGEWIGEISVDLLLGDEPGKAYRLIADNLIGDRASEAALNIMRGTHKLCGDSTIGLWLSETSEEYRAEFSKKLDKIYAGRIRSDVGWVRPVALVTQFGPKDAKWAMGEAGDVGDNPFGQMQQISKRRAEFYCSDLEMVKVLQMPDGESQFVVFAPCGEMPHWMRPAASFQESLDQALKARRKLQERPTKIELEAEREEVRERGKTEPTYEAFDDDEPPYEDRQKHLEDIGEKVRKQAGDNVFDLTLGDGRVIKVPYAPFARWALRHCDDVQIPEWKNVAYSGIKMVSDDPNHTDWVLGAGISLEDAYDSNVSTPAWDKAFEVQQKARKSVSKFSGIKAALMALKKSVHKAAVVVDAGERTGVVGEDIAVFPDSSPHRATQLEGISAIIVESGGALAHLAVVTRGRGITMMRHPKACELFQKGQRVTLTPATGRIIIEDEDE